MGMVFCRGCGKEIHDSALVCPACGATQGTASGAPAVATRNTGMLILMGLVWSIAFWIGALVIAGAIAGATHPDNGAAAGAEVGEALSVPLFVLAIIVASVMTVAGWLPGTRRRP